MSETLHVAFYMHHLAGGGVERMRLRLMNALRIQGIRVSLVLGNSRGRLSSEVPAGLPIIDLACSRTIAEIPKLIGFLRTKRPDIFVSSLDHNNIAAMCAHVLARSSSRLIICQHNTLSAERVLGWKYRIVPFCYWLFQSVPSAIIAVSRGVATDLAHTARLPRRKICVIYNPVIAASYQTQAAETPHAWLGSRDVPTFLFIGRLTQQKNVEMLLRALQILLYRKAARLLIIGEGEERLVLQEEVVRRGLETSVEFVGFQQNVEPWLRHASALIVPSRYEGLGNVIIEALACGTQVIATDCPHGPAEILLEGSLGTLVPVDDAVALAGAMEDVENARTDPHLLIERAESFTDAACVDAHLALFTRILGKQEQFVHALGIVLSNRTIGNIVDEIVSTKAIPSVRLIVTPNLDHVRLLRRREFSAAYAFSYCAFPDGFPVWLYARVFGLRAKERITGCALLGELLSRRHLRDKRVSIVVESLGTARHAEAWLENNALRSTSQVLVAASNLACGEKHQASIVQEVKRFQTEILIMTLGAPVSEEFVYRHRQALPKCWCLCVGQALRVELGLVPRAPRQIGKIGLEWLWRMAREPSRLAKRYVFAALWFPFAIISDLRSRC